MVKQLDPIPPRYTHTTFLRFLSARGPGEPHGGAHGPQIFGPIERKMLRALQARATFFAIPPPRGPGEPRGTPGIPGNPPGTPGMGP